MLKTWLKEALDSKNLSQSELARLLTERLGRSIDRAAVNKMVKGTRKITGDEAVAIAEISAFPLPAPSQIDEENTVPVVGYVGAGASMNLFSEAQGELDRVRSPDGATKDTVAVEVRGSSLGELFNQWLVYYDKVYDPPSSNLVGRLCVVGLADGRVLVKQIKPGQIDGHWNLMSNTEPPIYDAVVMWAARVKQMTPK